jgi:hypothetical protein
MAPSGRGMIRKGRAAVSVSLRGKKRKCKSLFLDSGAHSLYNEHTKNKKGELRYVWYAGPERKLSKEFRKYLDLYVEFIKKHESGIDVYATVDVIYNPELSWQSLKYLEDKGLKPVPVVHHKTPMRWLQKHLDAGYDYIGVGGLGQESNKWSYHLWGDQAFDLVCQTPGRLPQVKVHGFAMASPELMIRYPWYSVDTASWAKLAGFGAIYVPHLKNGSFDFEQDPYYMATGHRSRKLKVARGHYRTVLPMERKVLEEWLEFVDVPIGSVKDGEMDEYGVISSYNARAVANIRYFQLLAESCPKWPWPFKIVPRAGFFSYEDLR